MEAHAKAPHEIVHIAGDEDHGVNVTHDITKTAKAKVQLIYRGRHRGRYLYKPIECEVYEAGGELSVHTICPRCAMGQMIYASAKSIEYDAERGLFIEAFECPGDFAETAGADGRHNFGMGLCKARLVYDGFEVKDA